MLGRGRVLVVAVLSGALAASSGCFDPRRAASCAIECTSSDQCGDGLMCVEGDRCAPAGTSCSPDARSPDGDEGRDADPDALAFDAAPAPLVLAEALTLSGPGRDELLGVATSGGVGPLVAGWCGGGPGGMFGTAVVSTDAPSPDLEGIVASVNSWPLGVLGALPIPRPTSSGPSTIRAVRIAVGGDDVVASGTTGPATLTFAPAQTRACAGAWLARWTIAPPALRWATCYPEDVTIDRVRVHPVTGALAVTGTFDGTFAGTISNGVDAFVATLDGAGDPIDTFVVNGPNADAVLDLVPYEDGWIAVGRDVRSGFGDQGVVWQLDATLAQVRKRDLGTTGTSGFDVATAVTIGPDGLVWVAVALAGAATFDALDVDAEVVLVALEPLALPRPTPEDETFAVREAIELDAPGDGAVFVKALAATPGGVVLVGAARGNIDGGPGWLAPGVASTQQPLYGRVRRDGKALDAFAQLPLDGGTGVLEDVAWMPDGAYAVGSFSRTLTVGGTGYSAVGLKDGVVLRFTP